MMTFDELAYLENHFI